MLDQLMSSIGGDVVKSITEKAGISAEQAQQVLPIATDTLQSGLMEQVTGGNVESILGMFNSGDGVASNGLFGSLKGMMMKNVMTKMGLPESVAGLVAGSGMESVISGLTGQLGGAGNITQDGLMDKLGMGGGLGDMAKKLAGDKLKDLTGGLGGGLFG